MVRKVLETVTDLTNRKFHPVQRLVLPFPQWQTIDSIVEPEYPPFGWNKQTITSRCGLDLIWNRVLTCLTTGFKIASTAIFAGTLIQSCQFSTAENSRDTCHGNFSRLFPVYTKCREASHNVTHYTFMPTSLKWNGRRHLKAYLCLLQWNVGGHSMRI